MMSHSDFRDRQQVIELDGVVHLLMRVAYTNMD